MSGKNSVTPSLELEKLKKKSKNSVTDSPQPKSSRTDASENELKSPRLQTGDTRTTKTKHSLSRNVTPASRGTWVTYNSPLWRKDRVKTGEELSQSMPTTPRILSRMETGFVNDAINTHIKMTRRNPIIPPYDALSDKYAQAYFKSPFVQGIMERNKSLVHLKELKTSRTVNKLSVRRRCKATPDVSRMRERETGFVNDAIITEKKRNKYKDIIPPYDARQDKLCKAYFQRGDIKRLVGETCAPRAHIQQKGVMT